MNERTALAAMHSEQLLAEIRSSLNDPRWAAGFRRLRQALLEMADDEEKVETCNLKPRGGAR
ncbi:MAG: hypothetical protein JW900_11515 [Anaerolineae bacterium]|nr:hypothetical protein [Anaerolineae bacterium]